MRTSRYLLSVLAAATLALPTLLTAGPTPALANQSVQLSDVSFDAVTGEGTNSESARADAFRNAIAQAVGVYVQADTVIQDYITKSDKIRTSSKGFIKSFKLISEQKQNDGIIKAVYQIVVSTKPLAEDVADVVGQEFRNVGHPTVAVVGWFKGNNREETEVNVQAVTALNRALIQRGYKVVDASEIEKLRKQDSDIAKASGNLQLSNFESVAQQIANKLLADIYVTTYGSYGGGKTSIATKMYNAYTGQLFGSETGYASYSGGDAKRAVDLAISGSMNTILSQASHHWQDVLTNGLEFVVVIEGLKNGNQRRDFKRILGEASGVTNVKQVSAMGARAEFSVYATAEPIDLFDEIIEMAQQSGMKFVRDEAVVRGGRALFILRG